MHDDAVIREVNKRIGRVEIASIVFVGVLICGGLAFIVLIGRSLWLAVGIGGLLAACATFLRTNLTEWDRARRTTRIVYPSSIELDSGWKHILRARANLASSPTVWFDPAPRDDSAPVVDTGAYGMTVKAKLPFLSTNVEVWSLSSDTHSLFFLPDRLLVWERNRYHNIHYKQLKMRSIARTYRGPTPPPGAKITDQSWQHVRRDGQPDRRYKQNDIVYSAQIAQITLSVDDAFDYSWMVSNPAAAGGFVDCLHQAQRALETHDAPACNIESQAQHERKLITSPRMTLPTLLLVLGLVGCLGSVVAKPVNVTPSSPVRSMRSPPTLVGPATEEADLHPVEAKSTVGATPGEILATPRPARDGPKATQQPATRRVRPTINVPLPPQTKVPLPATKPSDTPTSTPTPPAQPSPTPTTPVPSTNGVANLRAGPGTNYSILGQLKSGSYLAIVARSPNGEWYELASKAWIWAKLVSNAPDVAVATDIPMPPTATSIPLQRATGPVECASLWSGARYGAICSDGWRSYSTGRGTCSWHGGVAYWLVCP